MPFKKTLDPSSITSPNERTALSGLHSPGQGKDPHFPASPIHTLAVTSTPTLNPGGQSEELGSDGGNTPQIGEEGFQSIPSRGETRDFRQELRDSLPCPAPPQGSDEPPHTGSHPSQKRSDCGQPPTLLVGGGGGSGRGEGDSMGMSAECPT